MGSALPRPSNRSTQSSRPVITSNARKRLSSVDATNSRPLAVTIAAARPGRPVFCRSSGSSAVMPTGCYQTTSPVEASTAVIRPHGGFWHGKRESPIWTSKLAGRGPLLS